ncbi:MAG: choice-of-anchor J domain-containing protein, partial [bacterium]
YSGSTPYRAYYRMRSSAGVWSNVDTVSTDGTQWQYYPTLAVRADTVYYIWSGATTTPYAYRELMCRTKRGTWGPLEQMTARGSVTFYPSAVADNNGECHVAWYDAYNGNNDIWYLRRMPDVPNDVGVKSITVPGNVNGRTTSSVQASAVVKNYGLNPQSNFGVVCTLYGAGGVSRSASARTIGALAVGAETTLTFDTYNFTIFETLDVVVRTTLSGDQQPANDRANTPSILWRPQYTGGPDAGMMKGIDSDTTGGPTYAWRSIRGTGTPVPFPSYDDAYATIPVGFTFNHYGTPYTSVNVYTNGYLNFGSIYNTLSNNRIPSTSSPNNLIAPLFDDLHCWASGRVNYQVFGTTPNCTLLVSYEKVRYYGAFGDSSLSFQVLLCENSGDIIFQYDSVYVNYLNYANGNSATVGIENSTGTAGLEYLYGNGAYLNGYTAMPLGNLLSSDRAIRFYKWTPSYDVSVNAIGQPTYPIVFGAAETLTALVKNNGIAAVGAFDVRFSQDGTLLGTANVTGLGIGESAFVSVGFTPAAAEVRGYFGVAAALAGDELPGNDSLTINDWVFPAGTYQAMGFEDTHTAVFPPTGWAAVNADLGTQNWLWYTGAGIEHTGINFTGVRYESSLLRNDDWLITSAVTPSALTADTFGFFWRSYLSSFPESLEVWVMSGQTGIADTIALLYAANDTATTHQAVRLSLDAYDGTAIYLGFRYVSLDMYYAFVDDIWWQAVYPAVAAPNLISPANGATGVLVDGDLTWEAAANATAYDVYLGTTNPPTILVGDDVTGLTLAYSGLTANTTYYWYVEAHNPGSSAQSTVWAFTTETGGPPPPGGWSEYAQVPVTPSGKLVKDGGWIAWDDLTQQYYVSKGYKTGDFYSFEPVTKTWTTLPTMPLGVEAKPPYKGSVGASDGNGTIYATKGNNKSGFWKYTVADSVWTQLTDVPLGLSNKKVKGGTDMVYIQHDTVGYVYLLKGYKCEFYRYNVAAMTWETLAEAPIGVKNKYDKGSWLAHDADRNLIYAHKAKYMEMYAYDLDSMAWSAMMPGMPLANGQTGKSKKAK